MTTGTALTKDRARSLLDAAFAETETMKGDNAKLQVIAFVTIEEGLIASLTELTRPMQA